VNHTLAYVRHADNAQSFVFEIERVSETAIEQCRKDIFGNRLSIRTRRVCEPDPMAVKVLFVDMIGPAGGRATNRTEEPDKRGSSTLMTDGTARISASPTSPGVIFLPGTSSTLPGCENMSLTSGIIRSATIFTFGSGWSDIHRIHYTS
jgi:hypothetical protein